MTHFPVNQVLAEVVALIPENKMEGLLFLTQAQEIPINISKAAWWCRCLECRCTKE